MTCKALLQDLGAEHSQALVLLKVALILLDVVSAPLHLCPTLPQEVLLLLQPALDDLCTICQPLPEVLRALLRNKLRLQGVKLNNARVLVDKVNQIGCQDVDLGGRLLLLLLLGALAQRVHPGALARRVVDRRLEDVLPTTWHTEVSFLPRLSGSQCRNLVLLFAPLVELEVRFLMGICEALTTIRLHLQQLLRLCMRGLGLVPWQSPQCTVLIDVGD
mmetsp:Transcript_48647/g.140957  ORF Transcript_48647/g.140957 Transcript_48647/m.140957 type:complete len:218 (+) Transcript_48647:201-854(+)